MCICVSFFGGIEDWAVILDIRGILDCDDYYLFSWRMNAYVDSYMIPICSMKRAIGGDVLA